MRISDSPEAFDPSAVAGRMPGAIDSLRSTDAAPLRAPDFGMRRFAVGTTLAIGGWAVEEQAADAPPRVLLVVDGARLYEARTGFGRFDVKALVGDATPERIGFRCEIPTDDLVPGLHAVRAYALGGEGRWYEAGEANVSLHRALRPERPPRQRDLTLRVDGVRALSEHGTPGPLAGIVPEGHFAAIGGWALDRTTGHAPAGICVVDDAGGEWSGNCDLVRDDVRSALGTSETRLGFEIVIPAESLGRGLHDLSVCAFDADGSRIGHAVAAEVQVAAEIAPFPSYARESHEAARCAALATIDGEPVVLRPDEAIELRDDAIVQIEGWAIGGADESPGRILLELTALGSLMPRRYFPVSCYRRRTAAKRLEPPPVEDAWFFYVFDPSDLVPRTYALSAIVLAANDGCYTRGELGRLRVVATSDSGTRRT